MADSEFLCSIGRGVLSFMEYIKSLPIQNANIRDLGGYKTAYGKLTKKYTFIRSGYPYYYLDSEKEYLFRHDVSKILDLRKTPFLSYDSDSFCYHYKMEYVSCPCRLGEGISYSFSDENFDWSKIYIHTLKNNMDWIRAVFKELSDMQHKGIVIHCTCGKDRTGIISMLLLMLSRVDKDSIAKDYALSSDNIKKLDARVLKITPCYLLSNNGIDFNHPFFESKYDSVMKAINYIEDSYQSVDNYLFTCGVKIKEIDMILTKFYN